MSHVYLLPDGSGSRDVRNQQLAVSFDTPRRTTTKLLRQLDFGWILLFDKFQPLDFFTIIHSIAERINTIMPLHHPNEPLVEIVGIEDSASGRSCEAHNVCGEALSIDSIVRFRKVQILNGKQSFVVASLQRIFMSLTYFLSTFFANQQDLVSKNQPSVCFGSPMG